ncbi:hypothetical protein [uncultured Sphingomonas sp.]|uniref:hypothetical protein n=1 Tax=uncultured Sphingomonas sp. TaxID=158754 RepID=UPI0035C95209
MRLALIGVLLFGVAGETSAQTGYGFAYQTRIDAGGINGAITNQARVDTHRAGLTTPDAWRPDGEQDDIRRAAAWGRCVLRATPDGGNAYLLAQTKNWQDPRPYRAAFQHCRDQVGRFGQDHRPMVLRAAITEAHRAVSTPIVAPPTPPAAPD